LHSVNSLGSMRLRWPGFMAGLDAPSRNLALALALSIFLHALALSIHFRLPDIIRDKYIAPSLDGGKEWHPMSYSRRTKMVYVPVYDFAMDLQAKKMEWKRGEWYLGAKVLNFNAGAGHVKAFDAATGKVLVAVDPAYFRPTEVDLLLGDSTKARERLGWTAKTSLEDLVKDMMKADLEEAARDEHMKKNGFAVANARE